MGRGVATTQTAENLVAFSSQLQSLAMALRAVADEMTSLGIDSIVVEEGTKMAYRSIDQFLERFVASSRQGIARYRRARGDFGDIFEKEP